MSLWSEVYVTSTLFGPAPGGVKSSFRFGTRMLFTYLGNSVTDDYPSGIEKIYVGIIVFIDFLELAGVRFS